MDLDTGFVRISADTPRRARKAQTYLPEGGSRDEILDFAALIRELERSLASTSSKAALVDPNGQTRPIPDEIFRILDQVTNALAAGEGITVVPQGMTMTSQQAADFLGISRPTLVRLLEAGEIPFEKPGGHRRVRLEDLVAYQERSRSERGSALRELHRSSVESKVQVGYRGGLQCKAEVEDQ